MQIFMRDISFAASEEDIKVALAQALHRPPFPVDPPINFHVDIFRDHSKKNRHRGMGILTLPTTEIGTQFLTLFGEVGNQVPTLFRERDPLAQLFTRLRGSASALSVKGRPVKFTPSNRPANDGIVELVRTRPWEDPIKARQEKERWAQLSGPIVLSKFSFGRFCRDGVFSPEASYRGSVACNVEERRIEITRERSVDTPRAPGSPFNFVDLQVALGLDIEEEELENLGDLLLDDWGDTFSNVFSVVYPSNRITALATQKLNASEHHVFIQSSLPPHFQRTLVGPFEADDDEPIPERTSSFSDADFGVTSRAAQGLRLVFTSRQDLDTFLVRCRTLHLPDPLTREIPVMERSIYAPAKLQALDESLRSLKFRLAFEVDKAVWGGILEPDEAVSLQDSLVKLWNQTRNEFECAAIFRYFLTTLSVPGVEAAKAPKRKRRGRTRRQQVLDSPLVDLPQKLAEAIHAYIAELYQPKGRYTPSAAICQSYHLVLTPSTQILEGPLPDQSNSVLRRFKNQEHRFLRVSFQDENRSSPRRDARLSINELLDERYKKPLNSGLRVAGRRYEFLGYSMSGLKEYSFIFVHPFQFGGVKLNADKIRSRLGDFSKISHRPALLGARWSQAFSASDPSVTLEEDQILLVDDITSPTESSLSETSHTSVSTPVPLWRCQRGARPKPPTSSDVLCFRPSQTKFEAADLRTLDIAATSSRPILAYLNRPLIALLEYHGTQPTAFTALQQLAIDEVQRMKNSLLQASKIFSQHGFGASFRLPSLFNNLYYQLKFEIGEWSDPDAFRHQLIKTTLAYATTQVLREIKHRAHILIPGSYTLIGVSDEWGCLEEGEIFATVVDERAGLNLPITGRIMITRSPQIHPGDIQFAQAVRRPQLEHLRNVVVFSCKGSRSLPSKLGGGDLDGDIYNLLLDENLYPQKNTTAIPGEYIALPPKETLLPCTVSDVADFVIDFIKSDLLGYISILHLRIADLASDGPGCQDCVKLAEHASHAVDFNKRGVPVDFKTLPKPPSSLKPDFLSGEGVNPGESNFYYPSVKILGQLYRSVPIEDYRPDFSEMENQRTDGEEIRAALASLGLRRLGLPSVDSPPDEDLLEEMRNILDQYSEQLLIIAKTHTTSKRDNAHLSEAELTGELAKAIRHEFKPYSHRDAQTGGEEEEDEEEEDEWDDEEDLAGDEERRREKFERAWAAWLVAEEALDDDGGSFGPSSFGLLALGTILDIVKVMFIDHSPFMQTSFLPSRLQANRTLNTMTRTAKVAVVGSGLAGLTAAHLLASHSADEIDFEVHLFEKAATLGMDSSSVSIGNADQEWRIDVPMRSFQGGYYPRLISLYTRLGVAFREENFTYSFSLFSQSAKTQETLRTTLVYNGASGRNGVGMPAWLQDLHLYQKGYRVFTRAFALGLFILSTVQLFVCYLRLIFFALPALRPKRHNDLNFEEWAAETVPRNFAARLCGFDTTWKSFTRDVLIPLFSAVCTAPEEGVNAHPAEEFLDYIWLTLGTHHYVVVKGVRDAVLRLTTNVKHIHLSSRLTGVHADPNNPRLASIECSTKTGTTTYHGFHHIIFATQANRVGPLLSSYASSLPPDSQARHSIMAQINCLDEFDYIRTIVINHTDASSVLLPPDVRDRRDLNLVTAVPSARAAAARWSPHRVSPAYTMATQILVPPRALRAMLAAPVFQTTNPFVPIADDRIVSVATLERALLTPSAKAALRGLSRETRRAWWQCAAAADTTLGELQGAGRRASDARPGVWLCGSYAHVGIPLLEGCVVSARNVYWGICESEGVRPGSASTF
ncbi:RNA dependent RNA polymerase-domain-containing protein [Mycena filopes]|nr:RNA dependent RNA polymerase-domain-containing protein [Mycena filopes]